MKPAVAITIGFLGGFFINEFKLVDNVWSASNAAPLAVAEARADRLRAGTASGEYLLAQAIPVETAPVDPKADPKGDQKVDQKVDETALRYFAAQGDTRRLEAEIARLRALYPSWTPPENPLAVRQLTDPLLDQMWKLYSENKLPELRKAISDRQTAESGWLPPADLMQRLQIAEAREQLINASNLKQYDTVIRLGSTNTSLLTCGDVDVLWRVAEAFASTKRPERARDTYLYVLQNCEKSEERVATVQKAMSLLARSDIDQLLALERQSAEGKGEFDKVRADIARSSLAAGSDPQIAVPQSDVVLVEKLAAEGPATDSLLLGWYYLHHDKPSDSEKWFRKAFGLEETATAAEGLALSLLALDRPAEAEEVLYKWRGTTDETRASYLAGVANLLAQSPPPTIAPETLQRMVAEIFSARDGVAAQQLGWYAYSLNQLQTAALWFQKSLEWKPDEEAAAYGLALVRWKLGDTAGVQQIQAAWAGRSDRIPTIGTPSMPTGAIISQPPQGTIPASPQPQQGTIPASPQPLQGTAPVLSPLPLQGTAVVSPQPQANAQISQLLAPRAPVGTSQGVGLSRRHPKRPGLRRAAQEHTVVQPATTRPCRRPARLPKDGA